MFAVCIPNKLARQDNWDIRGMVNSNHTSFEHRYIHHILFSLIAIGAIFLPMRFVKFCADFRRGGILTKKMARSTIFVILPAASDEERRYASLKEISWDAIPLQIANIVNKYQTSSPIVRDTG